MVLSSYISIPRHSLPLHTDLFHTFFLQLSNMKTILVYFICVSVLYSSLSPLFYEWINETYDEGVANRLNWEDLGAQGSFGGGNYPNRYDMAGKGYLIMIDTNT